MNDRVVSYEVRDFPVRKRASPIVLKLPCDGHQHARNDGKEFDLLFVISELQANQAKMKALSLNNAASLRVACLYRDHKRDLPRCLV